MALVFLPGVAQAKGPFEVVVSGGDLPHQVVIPVEEMDRLMSGGHGFFFPNDRPPIVPPPATLPQVTYSVNIYQVLEGGGRDLLTSLTYYPAHGNEAARLWEQATGNWIGIDPAFEGLLNRYIQAALSGSGDGPSPIWYIAPSVAGVAGLAVAALTGRKLLRRLRSD